MMGDSGRDFCNELREKTKIIHDESDNLVNLKLAAVLTDTQLWGQVLGDFYFVFETLEQALGQYKDHCRIAPLQLVVEDMLRTGAFQKDLLYYLGQDWNKKISPSLHAQRYCDRLLKISDEDPTLLIA